MESRDGGGFVFLNHSYFPPDVVLVSDPLDADRHYSRTDALEVIDGVHKQDSKNYRACRIAVDIVRAGVRRV